jgi:hypothetical protein
MAPILGIYASQISGHLFAPSGAYDSIATTTLGSATASITFSSIPATYTHLQIRVLGSMSASGADDLCLRFNSDTGSNYAAHYLVGNGTSASAGAYTSATFTRAGANALPTATSTYGVAVIDLLDYANTSKYKTMRALAGNDTNGAGYVALGSGLWQSSTAINTILLYPFASTFTANTQIALYGIKGGN